MLKLYIKVFRTFYSLILRWILFIFDMLIGVGSKFILGTIPTPAYDLQVKITDLEI